VAWLDASVKAAIFDIGATLVTGPPVAPNKVIAGLLKEATAAEVASVIMTQPFKSAHHVQAVLEERFGPLDAKARLGIEILWESQALAARELEGASQTVCDLKKSGLKIGLLSDIWSPYYQGVEAAIPEVIRSADSIVLSFRTGSRKPSPANFRASLAELEVAPEEAVMIGDTYEHDILPAIELGMRTIWVLARPDREAESLVRVVRKELPAPTEMVYHIYEVPSLNTQL
jgi:FMN phosphatase YigB (HAD superfamily)